MALVIPLIVAGVAAAELVLRYQASRVLSFDVEHFPYYRRPKNAQGKEVTIAQVGWAGVYLGRIDYFFELKKKKKHSSGNGIKISDNTK